MMDVETICRHCSERIFQRQGTDRWLTVYKVSGDGYQCPRWDEGIIVNDGHEPITCDRCSEQLVVRLDGGWWHVTLDGEPCEPYNFGRGPGKELHEAEYSGAVVR